MFTTLSLSVSLLESISTVRKRVHQRSGPIVVGIVGPPACGKTHLSRAFLGRNASTSVCLEETNWILPRRYREQNGLSGISVHSYDIAAMRAVLSNAKAGSHVEFREYDPSGRLPQPGVHVNNITRIETTGVDMIILDGCPWFYDAFADDVDLYVLVMPQSLEQWRSNLRYRDTTERGRNPGQSLLNFHRNLETVIKEVLPILHRASLYLVFSGSIDTGECTYIPSSPERVACEIQTWRAEGC